MGVIDILQTAGTLGVGTALPSLARTAWRWANGGQAREATRVQTLEQLIDALRRALDKGRLREDALAQVLGVLIFGLRHIEGQSPVIDDAIERAIEILERAQDRLNHVDERGDQ